MGKLPLIILLATSAFQGLTKDSLYDLRDLEALEKDKNFEEFLQHVNDLRPTERGKHWREMYQSMAIALIDYKIKIKDYSRTTFNQVEQMGRSAALSNDEYYQLKRAGYNKKYFSECFKKASLLTESTKTATENEACESDVSSYWYFSRKDPDIGLELAAILEGHQSSLKLWPFYEVAIKDSIANFYCQRPKIQEAVIKKLYEESFSADFDGNYKTLIKRVAPDKCFNELIPTLKATLKSTKSSGLDKEMAMNLLEARGKLSADEEDLYSVLYLLDGPVVGDKMNIAWKKIEGLSEKYEKRMKLLSEIEKLPLIPDRIFKDPGLPRNKAIINLFAKHFPEYLNYYGASCIKLIRNATDSTINVQGTYQCQEFLKAAQSNETSPSTPWITDTIKTQYSALKKF